MQGVILSADVSAMWKPGDSLSIQLLGLPVVPTQPDSAVDQQSLEKSTSAPDQSLAGPSTYRPSAALQLAARSNEVHFVVPLLWQPLVPSWHEYAEGMPAMLFLNLMS